MYVKVTSFVGFDPRTTSRSHTVSLITDGYAIFENEVKKALDSDMDVYSIEFVMDDVTQREITFHDRHDARMEDFSLTA